ncbi:MAG TPA: hypothetical protein VFH27_12305, partial [Longimicrobiaceae bacterium]|nr:hypothetical protein [Longimicrobiaceae bacterium]
MAIKIRVMIDLYAPGYKAGGPLRTIQNMVQQLGGELAFRVVTRDRDDGDARAYDALPTGRWTPAGKGEVIYLSPRMLGMRALRGVIAAAEHDVLYLNSLFSPRFAFVPLVLRRLGAIPRRPLVLAPRGELHPGALAVGAWPRWVPAPVARAFAPPKQAKKRAYLAACRALGLLRDV